MQVAATIDVVAGTCVSVTQPEQQHDPARLQDVAGQAAGQSAARAGRPRLY